MAVPTTPLAVAIPNIEQLTQNAQRLLQQSLAQAAQAAGPQAIGAMDLDLARSNIRALSFVQAMGLHGAYRYLRDFIARQAVPIYSAGRFLDGWLATYDMARKPASAATGTVNGVGVNGTVLPAGTMLHTGTSAQFRTTADATVVGGVVVPPVEAVVEGLAGNLAMSTALTLMSPVAGIDSTFYTGFGPLAGGADLESDELVLVRLQQRLAFQPMGGAPADYARWALEVAGITRAWGVRNPGGPTTAGVIIMADVGGVAIVPSVGQRDAVLDYIRDPLRGPPDELFVILPTLVPVDFEINLEPDTSDIRAGVVAALQDLFFREAVPGGSIPHGHVVEAISGVVGEFNHTISVPAIVSGDFFTVADFSELLTLGTVDFA